VAHRESESLSDLDPVRVHDILGRAMVVDLSRIVTELRRRHWSCC